jgi:BlaI family transcriptional regulator, penicillinase repressor
MPPTRDISKGRHPHPTDAELEILNALWRNGPSTVRQVHEIIEKRNHVGYTTALKLLQIMHGKKLVSRDDSSRAHIYIPAFSRKQIQHQLLNKLKQSAFDGSTVDMVVEALSSGEAVTPEELSRLKKTITDMER